jgi:hypothetical protein
VSGVLSYRFCTLTVSFVGSRSEGRAFFFGNEKKSCCALLDRVSEKKHKTAKRIKVPMTDFSLNRAGIVWAFCFVLLLVHCSWTRKVNEHFTVGAFF